MGTRDIRRAARHWATRRAGLGAPGDVPLTGSLSSARGRRTFARESVAGRAERKASSPRSTASSSTVRRRAHDAWERSPIWGTTRATVRQALLRLEEQELQERRRTSVSPRGGGLSKDLEAAIGKAADDGSAQLPRLQLKKCPSSCDGWERGARGEWCERKERAKPNTPHGKTRAARKRKGFAHLFAQQ